MKDIKKYLMRGISIIMVAIVLVVSPASDYLDTQGIGETHAMGAVGGFVTLEALLTVAGLAYGVYVDNVHQSTLADELTASVERKGLVDVIPSITELKQGVTEFVITEALLYAIKDFFETEKAIDLQGKVQQSVNSLGSTFDSLPDSEYKESFFEYLSTIENLDDYWFIRWESNVDYESGYYTLMKPRFLDMYSEIDGYSSHAIYSYSSPSAGRYFLGYSVFDSAGLPLNSSFWWSCLVCRYSPYSGGWQTLESDDFMYHYAPIYNSNFKTLKPFLITNLTDSQIGTASLTTIMTNTVGSVLGTSYGSYDQANLDKLKGLTVTENQLVAVQNDLFPQIDEQRELQASAQTIADLISFQLADSLSKNFAIAPDDGETDTPTDTPTEGVTVGEQAIIDQSVANATGIKGAIQSATQAITDFFTAPLQGIKTVLDNIYTTLTGVVSGVVEGVKTGVKAILTELFVPDTAELEEAVYSMTEKFSFADSLLTLAEDIGNKISAANGPPVIYIDFSESEDERYQSIGKLVAVDFAWYERYKPYGDMILSAVLWCFFILRMLRGAPSIFKGMQSGMEVPDSTYQPFGNYVPPSQRIDMK